MGLISYSRTVSEMAISPISVENYHAVYLTLPLRDSAWNWVRALELKTYNDRAIRKRKKYDDIFSSFVVIHGV